jgi:glyoxylase-like metal-dependent hydrolase (beta-lactamase superfamily II)
VPHGDVGFSGNVVAVITGDGVLVFDSTCLPGGAETIIAEIRKLTPQPVRYLVNSHWHWDHWQGNHAFVAAFPEVQIISHEATRELMQRVSVPRSQRDIAALPGYINSLEQRLAALKSSGAAADRIAALEEILAADKYFLEQKQRVQFTLPNTTYSGSITIWMGGREIRLLHARAITPGDTLLYLPKEKVLATGDVFLQPCNYSIGGTFPTDWIATLKKLAEMDVTAIVPGHGEVQHNKDLLERNIRLCGQLVQAVKDAKSRGLTEQRTVEQLGAKAADWAAVLGISRPAARREFKAYFLDVFLQRAYRELDGPLKDL